MKKGTKHFEIGVNKKNYIETRQTFCDTPALYFEVRQKLKIHFIAVQSPIFF